MRTLRLWLNEFVIRSASVVALLALAGVIASVFVLWWPEAGPDLPARAGVSSAVATVFALLAAIVAVSAAAWVTTSDYRAGEAVKKDTARLKAAVRIIMYKSALNSQRGASSGPAPSDGFKEQREFLHEFLLSTTAFAYLSWTNERSAATPVGTDEPWRVFFLNLVSLADALEPPVDRMAALTHAVEVDRALFSIQPRDFKRITSYTNFSKPVGGIADLQAAEDSSDSLLAAVASIYGRSSDGRDANRGRFQHLKRKGVNDPNIDMFVAVFESDTAALNAALEAGADPSATDNQVLAAYEAELADFDSAEWTAKD